MHPHSLLLTSGTAQWSGHPFVHDEQCAVQPRALHGHLYLLDARVQGPLPILLSGEDGVALATDLSRRWTHGRCGRGKAWIGGEDGWMDGWIQAEKSDAGGTKGAERMEENSLIMKLGISLPMAPYCSFHFSNQFVIGVT